MTEGKQGLLGRLSEDIKDLHLEGNTYSGELMEEAATAIRNLMEYARHQHGCHWKNGDSCECGYIDVVSKLVSTDKYRETK